MAEGLKRTKWVRVQVYRISFHYEERSLEALSYLVKQRQATGYRANNGSIIQNVRQHNDVKT
jgi:hypothetical protein